MFATTGLFVFPKILSYIYQYKPKKNNKKSELRQIIREEIKNTLPESTNKLSDKFKDVIELGGYYYTVYLTIDPETGNIIDKETWIE